MSAPEPQYFETPTALRAWFTAHAASASVLVVGYMKTGSGQASITWPQSVDEALCVGWIDGVRQRIDAQRYKIRFTPRKPRSHWSAVNIRRFAELQAEGRVQPAGLAAFQRRTEANSRRASFEQDRVEFNAADLQRFQAEPAAWSWFQASTATYRRQATWWVISAKQAGTRERRLGLLIAKSAAGLKY